VTTFPTGVATKPSNITDGLQILAAHVSSLWDETISMQSELMGAGAGSFFMDLRPTTAGSVVFQSRQLTGDTQPRFQITGSGDHRWGSGTAATDVTLVRSGTRTLTLSGSQIINVANAADTGLAINANASQSGPILDIKDGSASIKFRVSSAGLLQFPTSNSLSFLAQTLGTTILLNSTINGEPNARYIMDSSGKMTWGSGSATQDTNLYRGGTDELRTDDSISVRGDTAAAARNIDLYGPAATAVAERVFVAGDTQSRVSMGVDASGRAVIGMGPGGASAQDTGFTRTSAGTMTVTGTLSIPTLVVGSSASIPTLAVSSALTAPTAGVDTNTTTVATTAFVLGQAGAATVPVGSPAATGGSSARYARADHRHALEYGIWNPSGTPSRLNTVSIFAFGEGWGGILGDGLHYRAATDFGWIEDTSQAVWQSINYDFASWAAVGGTVQWRWLGYLLCTVAVAGSSSRNLVLKYLNINEGGAAGSLTIMPGGTSSFGASTGLIGFDTGWQNAPGASGLMLPHINSNRVGGSAGAFSRSGLHVQMRVI
jgi:hypothetical protein